MVTTIENKELRGLSLRLIIVAASAIVTFVSAAAFFVGSIKSDIKISRDLLIELREGNKEDRMNAEIWRRNMEAMQRSTDIRLTIIETQLKK